MKTTIRLLAAGMFLAAFVNAFAQPTITKQPTDLSVSVGANVTFQVTATGRGPLAYQWRFNAADILDSAHRSLVLTNVQLANTGDYVVVVTDSSGSVTSQVAHLEVDPTFTKITTGSIVNDGGSSFACA